MAIIEPTIDHIDDQTVMLELRNLAGAVDKNEKALNDEMASIQESQDNLEQMVGGFQDSIDQNTADITTIKGNIQTIEEDLTTIESKNAEQDTAIQQNASDIVLAKTELNQKITAEQTARTEADSAEAIARANADIDLVDLTYASGGISIKLERPEGNLEDTVQAPFIKTATLIPTTTNRAFKIQFDLYDGTQYDTNEFVIPEGGGTDVSVTGVTISDGTSPDSFKVSIELSDGTPIASNDYPFPSGSAYPTSATLSMSGTTISISIAMSAGQPLTGSVDIAPALASYATKAELSELTGQMMNTPQNVIGTVTTTQNGLMQFADKVKLDGIAPNANNYVLPIGGTNIGGVKNGGNVTIESDGTMNAKVSDDGWEELDLDSWAPNFKLGDSLRIHFKVGVNFSSGTITTETDPVLEPNVIEVTPKIDGQNWIGGIISTDIGRITYNGTPYEDSLGVLSMTCIYGPRNINTSGSNIFFILNISVYYSGSDNVIKKSSQQNLTITMSNFKTYVDRIEIKRS